MRYKGRKQSCEIALLQVAASLLLVCGLYSPVPAQETTLPESVHYLTDYAEVLPEADSKKLEGTLFRLEQQTGIEFRIVLVSSTELLRPAAYADKLFREWHIGGKSGEGILLLFVTGGRSWEVRVTKDLSDELPNDRLRNLVQLGANEIAKAGYGVGLHYCAQLLIDELGNKRGFSYATISGETESDLKVPVRPQNPAPPPTLWTLIKLAFGIALSAMAMIVALGTGLGFLSSIFFRDRGEKHGRLTVIAKKAALFTVCGALIYYFWDSIVFYLRFARLLGEGIAVFGTCLFPIFAVFAFILLVYSLKQGGRFWLRYIQAGKRILNKPIVITLCLPLLLILLPRSEAAIVRSWEPQTGALSQVRNVGAGLFGVPVNSYTLDNFGRVRAIQVRRSPFRSLNELTGIGKLTVLERLDLEEVPLEGVQDVSALTSLQVLRLSQTHLTGLRGLEQLQQLEELEIDHVDIEALGDLTQLPKLRSLTLTDCRITDLARIGSLSGLVTLYLDGTNISDVAPLSGLHRLTQLSIADTAVQDLRPLKQLPIFALDIRGTRITDEQLRQTFPHPLLIVRDRIGIRDGVLRVEERFLPQPAKTIRNRGLFAIIAIAVLLWMLQYFRPFNSYSLVILRRLFSKTAWGVVLVLMLITFAQIKLPLYTLSYASSPDIAAALISWATIIGIGWLGLRPLLLLSLETKAVNASGSYVPVMLAARFMPAIAVIGPVSYRMIWGAIPSDLYFLSFTTLLLTFAIFGAPWVIALGIVLIGVRNWQHKLQLVRNLSSRATETIVEIPLRPRFGNILFGGSKNARLALGSEANGAKVLAHRPVVTTVSAAMLSRLPAGCSASVVGSVITIQQEDLFTLKRWEVNLISRWIEELYYKTWSPIWLVGDWVETLQVDSTVAQRNLAAFEGLLPYLSGTEYRFKLSASVFPLDSNENIQLCLAANELIQRQQLEAMSIELLLNNAFMPVAVAFRGLFGQAHLADRLDVLMRTTETAIALFALALTAEYEDKRASFSSSDREKIDAGLAWAFKNPPEFSDWVSLLLTFTGRAKTALAIHLRQILDEEPPTGDAATLRALLEGSVGAEDVRAGDKIKRRSQTLLLLKDVRNLLTAHGPVIERASPELYSMALIVTLDLLTALPWSNVSICELTAKEALTYQGLQVRELRPLPASRETGVFVRISEDDGEEFVAAHKYFRCSPDSVAMYIGEEGFFDPLAGLRV